MLLLAALIWTLPDFDPAELVPEWNLATAAWLLASTLTLVVAFALQTLRWDAVLVPMGYHLPFGRLFSEFLAGQFVSNVLPTAFAGDVIRVARLGHDIDHRPAAFASIALERLTGWAVLPTISLAAILVSGQMRGLGGATAAALAIDAVTLIALTAVLMLAAHSRWTDAAHQATGWRKWLAAIHLGITAIRTRPASVVWIVGAGVAFQVTQCLSIWMAARALGIDEVTMVAAFAFFPPTLIGQNLPVGFGGLGVREGGFVLFFGALGASNEQAIALGLVTYLTTVAASSLGAPFLAVGGRRWREVLEEAEEEAALPIEEDELELDLDGDADFAPRSP